MSDESMGTTRPTNQVVDIEFCLMYQMQPFKSGFMDTLTFELSDRINAVPEKRQRAKNILTLVGSPSFKGPIIYFPHHNSQHEKEFYKQRNGHIYVADMEQVARVATRLIRTLDEIMDHPNSLCRNLRIEGLGYFNGLKGERVGKLFVTGGPQNDFDSYSTTYDEGMDFRRWAAMIDQQTRRQDKSS